ncbi:MAG: acyl-CoA/sterol acyltransferase [Caeruleum heppii]|nr:MAG: acyl-CoA/sterol acyltransferase [Caeruleum heppii]
MPSPGASAALPVVRSPTGGDAVEVTPSTSSWNSQHSSSSAASTPSEEDYDALKLDPLSVIPGSKGGGLQSIRRRTGSTLQAGEDGDDPNDDHEDSNGTKLRSRRRKSIPIKLEETGSKGRYLLTADDPEIREILRNGLLHDEATVSDRRKPSRFSDLVFTRRFTAFDRHNPSSSSPFHGFFTLFWLGTGLLIVKIAAQNWKTYGNIFGTNQILSLMFSKDIIVLGLTDGVMCAATAFGLLLQKAILKDWLNWNKHGWIIQHIWQTFFIGAILMWARYRDWPWSHEIFVVLHCLCFLMKQHSYAFYNGYLSELYKRRQKLQKILKRLNNIEPTRSTPNSPTASPSSAVRLQPDATHEATHHRRRSANLMSSSDLSSERTQVSNVAAAIESGAPLDADQMDVFSRIIKREIVELTEELQGKSSAVKNSYPNNLTWTNWADYTVLPTLVYELEYPRQEHINWAYVAEKTGATFGCLGVMIVVSQAFIYPSVIKTVRMREAGMSLPERLQEFPWILSDMLFPFMLELLMSWYVIWECILNVLAELTRFADRGFYGDWWNSTSWDQYARDWNRPVHNFLLRHVYHSSISALRVSKPTATLITFFLSACVHELVMWCIFKKLRGYLMGMQMMQVPLVMLNRTRWLRDKKVLGNLVFWLGIMTGPSFLCSLYLII